MGNQLAAPQRLQPEILSELPNVVLKDSLGGGRLMKTLLCVHDDGGLVVVKVYHKRWGAGGAADAPDLRRYERQLADIRARLAAVPFCHAWPYQRCVETPRAAYLLRQHVHSDLHTRLSTRPFMSAVEKLWVSYQLLLGLQQSHAVGVVHGDIKCENCLLTSWGWAYIADFAPFKPARLPADNPAYFSFFFDTGSRRRCYVAPERFYSQAGGGGAGEMPADTGELEPSMDIFSMGCVLAELFLDGTALFDLSKLLAYRRREYNPKPALAPLAPALRELVLHMVQIDPGARLTASQYLSQWGSRIFPACFSAVAHPFFRSLLHMDADMRVAATHEAFAPLLQQQGGGCGSPERPPGQPQQHEDRAGDAAAELRGEAAAEGSSGGVDGTADALAAGSSLLDDMDALLADDGHVAGAVADSLLADTQRFLAGLRVTPDDDVASSDNMLAATLPHRADLLGSSPQGEGEGGAGAARPGRANGSPEAVASGGSPAGASAPAAQVADGQVMALVAVLLCTLLRGARLQENRIRAAMMLAAAACWLDDDMLLQRVVPYLLSLIGDHSAAVRWAALRCLARVLATVRRLPPSEAGLLGEYVLPSLSLVPSDPEEGVRAEYASMLAQLAADAQRFLAQQQLERKQQLQRNGSGGGTVGAPAAADGGKEPVGAGAAGASAQPQAAGRGDGGRTPEVGAASTTVGNDGDAPGEVLAAVRAAMERAVHELLVGARSSAATRRAILPQVQALAEFLGKTECNDFLLPALITFLNDADWHLRAAFYRSIGRVACFAGPAALEVVLLPCLERAADCPEEPVVAAAADCLAQMADDRQLRKPALLRAASHLLPRVLLHPSPAVRSSAVKLAAAMARALPPVDRYARLLPMLLPALGSEPTGDLADEAVLAACLLRPTGGAGCQDPQRSGTDGGGGSGDAPGDAASGGASWPPPPGGESDDGPPEWAEQHLQVHLPGEGIADAAPASAMPAAVYALPLQMRSLDGGGSFLGAALDTVAASKKASGHLIAFRPDTPNASASAAQRRSGGGSSTTLHATPQEVGQQLVSAAARIVPHAGGDLPGSPLGLAAGTGGRRSLGSLLMDAPAALRGGDLPGAGVSDAMAAALSTGMPTRPAPPSLDTSPWRPAGVLTAHYAEHRLGVNCLAVAEGGAFFVSGSDDCTAKVWDTRRIERDVAFRSRLTYSGHAGRVLAAAPCEDSQSVATACSDGELHVWRVEHTCRSSGAPGRYTGVVARTQLRPCEGAVLALQRWGAAGAVLLYATQRGGVHAADLRAPSGGVRDVWVLPQPPNEGVVRCMAADPACSSWLVTGSSRGVMTLWDVRFRLPVHSWRLPGRGPINALAAALAAPARLGLAGPVVPHGPMVYAASGANEVSLWGCDSGRCHEVLRVVPPHEPPEACLELPHALQPEQADAGGAGAAPGGLGADELDRHLALQELQAPQARIVGCRALLSTGAGPLLAAGSDRCIRLWDSLRPEASYVVCGPPQARGCSSASAGSGDHAPAYRARSVGAVRVVEETCPLPLPPHSAETPDQQQQQRSMPAGGGGGAVGICHQDAVTQLAYVDTADRLLLSCSRDGVIKAWR